MGARKQNSTYTRNEQCIANCNLTYVVLTTQLRALEKDGLIKRTVYAEVPPRVEYELTDLALELMPIFEQLSKWGGKHRKLRQS